MQHILIDWINDSFSIYPYLVICTFRKVMEEKSIARWFNRLYLTRKWRSMRPYSAYPVFLDYLEIRANTKLLDVGCGPGWLLKAAAERGMQGFGIDISVEAIRLARQTAAGCSLLVASANQLPFPAYSFDYVTCIGVVEHFVNPDRAIAELKRVIGKDSRMLVMVPNSNTLYWRLMEFASRKHRESNENGMSLEGWTQFFDNYGFRILQIYRDQWRLQKVPTLLGLEHQTSLLKRIRKMIWAVIPLSRAHQFVFVLRKS